MSHEGLLCLVASNVRETLRLFHHRLRRGTTQQFGLRLLGEWLRKAAGKNASLGSGGHSLHAPLRLQPNVAAFLALSTILSDYFIRFALNAYRTLGKCAAVCWSFPSSQYPCPLGIPMLLAQVLFVNFRRETCD